MGLGRCVQGLGLAAALLACASCESDQDGGDASAMGDASRPGIDAGPDVHEDASVLDGATSDAADRDGGAAGDAGEHDAAGGLDADVSTDGGGDADAAEPPLTPATTHVYVGGYSTQIVHLTLDQETGQLSHQGATNAAGAPSYLAIRPQRDALYALDEQSTAAASQVLAFAIDPETGELSKINEVPSGGERPRHVTVHPTGDWIAVAHYGSGHTTILPVRADRGVGGVIDVERGAGDAARQAHQAVFDARGTTLLVPCIQNNYVIQYQFNLGALALGAPASVAVAGGPRHVAFHPDQRSAYALSETTSVLTSFAYDGVTGQLTSPMTIAAAETTAGGSSHVAVHPSGRSLYVSNEADNSIGVFVLALDGRPQLVEHERGGLATPRDFAIDPQGRHLIVANHGGAQDLRVYRIDPIDGALTFVSAANVGGQPSSVVIAVLP